MRKADARKVSVVHASGDVITERVRLWFRPGSGGAVEPGDAIVPVEVDRVRALQLWHDIAPTVYSMAIAAVAANSFGHHASMKRALCG